MFVRAAIAAAAIIGATGGLAAQELGGAGTIQGSVTDPTGGAMPAVTVELSNPVTGLSRSATTDASGAFTFRNLPPNTYHLQVSAQGFATFDTDVEVRSAVPIAVPVVLQLAGTSEAVQVVGHSEALIERDPTAHTDIDQSTIEKLPLGSTSLGLNQVITMASPGVVADSNGFFHPVGDHAQTQFSIDNQPVTDQQSRIYSNQISPDAVQSMEVITGVAPAEYGDKTSLVVHIVTKSGLDTPRPRGDIGVGYGSFSTPTFDANVGAGSSSIGNFVSVSGLSTDRFLDPPEFQALHDHGWNRSLFNRFDAHRGLATFHLNTQAAQSSFDVPNTFDQNDRGQAQHQRIDTFNIAPGYSQVLGESALLTVNAFVRRDHLRYTPSADPFADTPATVSQDRKLTNMGIKADLAHTRGPHNLKLGGAFSTTALDEHFTLGFTETPDADPTLLAFDLSSGGSDFVYDASKTIKQAAGYIQDDITAGNASFKVGVRLDHYDGLTTATQLQPRLGMSYSVPRTGTLLRASYGRTMETPYNENLLLSGGFGLNGLFGQTRPPAPGTRNEGEFGVQQTLGNFAVVDFGYFVKRTHNAYDFGVLFDTPINFPISWDHSRLDGFTGRINIVERRGFSAFIVMAHTNAIFSPPGNGGFLDESPEGDFRIDHDQKFNSTTNVQYVFDKASGAWAALSWRYDSGLVAGAVASIDDALALTGDQQAAIGFFCGPAFATRENPITACSSGGGATRLRIPSTGTADALNNPSRIAPRHLFDIGFGADNLLRTARTRLKVRFSILNAGNKIALYNFLSTFSGTHFVAPRTYQFQLGIGF